MFFFFWYQPVDLNAQSRLHFSMTTGYEITHGYAPGYDITVLYNNRWGIRYMMIPDVQLSEKTEIQSGNDSVSAISIKGNLEIPMILRTIDYRTFNRKSAIPFDFVTAYTGVGYSNLSPRLTERKYSINGSSLTLTQTEKNVDIPVTCLVMGFYVGERFLVLDGKLLYFRGESDQSQTGGRRFSFDHWLIQISGGIFF